MECNVDMVQLDAEQITQCVVHDLTPSSEQKKINIVVRSSYTVAKVISNVTTQYHYETFDLVLQPNSKDAHLVNLNENQKCLLWKVPGFSPQEKNTLVLLPTGVWDGNVKKRYDFAKPQLKKKCISKSAATTTTTITTTTTTAASSTIPSIIPTTNGIDDYTNAVCNNNNDNNNVCNNNNNITNNNVSDLGGGDAATLNDDLPPSYDAATMASTNTASSAQTTHSLKLSPLSDPEQLSDDDLALGASASPTETEPYGDGVLKLRNTSPRNRKYGLVTESDMYMMMSKMPAESEGAMQLSKGPQPSASTSTATAVTSATTTMSTPSAANSYVGLVNQAMTCYLNSLLQALFMTPEFRNALYRWEFDNDNEAKNIPYQLQKLFLNLQTSKKSAVETTDLTRSFGWDSTEAWQQHDIQELCRVMFDALEHKFKNTKQMNLIASLYEGKMIDYVKCLECNTEKTRADTFLDIPLPVRPFGSTVAYGSIEEALRAFVQPETLDGSNKYFCEKCNKKCDAHKGLKFKNFPYILTLHLKRFDFDYQTMHRIKLNDKVTFPQTLNLNSFVNPADGLNIGAGAPTSSCYLPNGAVASNDDCSTTDSGSAMEEDMCCSGTATTASSSQHENDMNDDDEGIDMSTSTDHRVSSNASVDQRINHESGPYRYELFAIMIHSGSASGGHYYAYIKEFENNEWFCFNDQSVSPITEEDIQKSFGGGSSKGYYSSVYSSSTNAYMLMYRQIDAQRNEHITKLADFPEHINALLPKLHVEEETRGSRAGRHGVVVSDMAMQELIKPCVNFYNPELKKIKSTRVYVSSFNLNLVLESAHQMLNVEKFAPLSRCRLVAYDPIAEEIMQSLEDMSDQLLTDLRHRCEGNLEFLLEHRREDQEFEVYKPDGNTWQFYLVNLYTMQLDGPHVVHVPTYVANSALLHSIAMRLGKNENELLLATLEGRSRSKAFVAVDEPPSKDAQGEVRVLTQQDLQEIVQEQFRHLMYLYLNVPNTDTSNLEVLGIPTLEITPSIEISADVVDAVQMNVNHSYSSPVIGETASNTATPKGYHLTGSASTSEQARRESPLMAAPVQESNSEDSSLSDGDRTLVESMNNRFGADSQISSNSHSPYLSSPEDESYNKAHSLKRIHDLFHMTPDYSADSASQHNNAPQYFYAERIDAVDSSTVSSSHHTSTEASDDMARKPTHSYKIIVDSHMKMPVFTKHIESLIGVPTNYFKIQRKYDTIDPMAALLFFSEGETLSIELGKVLQPDEHKAKISFMRLSELDNDTGKLPCTCEWIYKSAMTVAEAKKELIAKLHRIDAKYRTLNANNCRLWLKGGRNPVKIMSDDETLGNDVRSTVSSEFLVQECEEGVNPQVSEDSLTIFVRRWYADRLQLGPFQEITLEKDSEIRTELTKITDIRQDHIAYSKINGSFPCTNISLLSINTTLSWFSIGATLDKYPLTSTVSGNVYFYKDVTKAPKEPTTEERRELSTKEKARLDRLGCMSTSLYSPRRERALKIYLDSPQSNSNNTAPASASTSTSTSTSASAVTTTSTTSAAD